MTMRWQDRPEGGVAIGLRAATWIALHLNRFALALLLDVLSLYFLCVRTTERRASREFLRKVFNKKASIAQVFRHFRTFAQVTADRVFFLTDRLDRIRLEVHGLDIVGRFVRAGRGCVVLGSHLGSFEAARAASLEHPGANVRMVLDRAVSRTLIAELVAINPEFGDRMIDADQAPASLGLEIAGALRAGESVGFLCDRHRIGDRTVSCDFMGSRAQFPTGPLIIAAALKAPVIMLFSTFADGTYVVYCEAFSDAFTLPRQHRDRALQENVQRFADRLAIHATKAPYNWFNFYDFWATDSE